jgi:predicted nucleotidyltransferase
VAMTEEVEVVLQQLIARAEQDLEVLGVILFGSRARGDAGPRSDVDVCLVLELRSVVPASFHEYLTVEKRRSSERLLQVAIEAGGALTGSAAGGIVVCCLARNSGKGDHSWISS